jgi:putative tricarboxylic transport membrane protein
MPKWGLDAEAREHGMSREQSSSLVWLSFALLICAETLRRLSLGSWRDPGPGFVPLLSGVVLGSLACIHFIQSTLRKRETTREIGQLPERWKTLIFIYLSLLAYVFLLEPLGFLPATFLLLIFLFRAAEPRRWAVVIGESAIVSLITYVIFDVLLKSQLPKGILDF